MLTKTCLTYWDGDKYNAALHTLMQIDYYVNYQNSAFLWSFLPDTSTKSQRRQRFFLCYRMKQSYLFMLLAWAVFVIYMVLMYQTVTWLISNCKYLPSSYASAVQCLRFRLSLLLQFRTHKVIYRRYAGLFFSLCVDITDNELAYLECIHLFVEILDHFFSNVCELDLVFNFHKVWHYLWFFSFY